MYVYCIVSNVYVNIVYKIPVGNGTEIGENKIRNNSDKTEL